MHFKLNFISALSQAHVINEMRDQHDRTPGTFDTIHGTFIAKNVRCVSRDDIIDRALIAIMFSLKVWELALLEN